VANQGGRLRAAWLPQIPMIFMKKSKLKEIGYSTDAPAKRLLNGGVGFLQATLLTKNKSSGCYLGLGEITEKWRAIVLIQIRILRSKRQMPTQISKLA
jgi:hypothetical protein